MTKQNDGGRMSADPLFEQYVAADTEARAILEELRTHNKRYRDAQHRATEAWNRYSESKKTALKAREQ